jgi:hypothetical protein
MNDLIEKALFFALGVLVTALITHLLAKDKDKQIHKKALLSSASIKFKEAFLEEIIFLKSGPEPTNSICGTAHDILKKAFEKHRIAYEAFKIELPKANLTAFDKAWEEYLYPELQEKSSPGPLTDYISEEDEQERRKLAHGKISALLKLAHINIPPFL